MSGGSTRKDLHGFQNNDEVERLLRAAEDEMLLNLSVDSHMSRVSPSYIDPDLDRRFQSLKSSSAAAKRPPAVASVSKPQPPPTTTITGGDKKRLDSKVSEDSHDDDLFARFAALKSSLPCNASVSSSSSADLVRNQDNHPSPGNKIDGSSDVDVDVDVDEVQKVILWAIDAARLDPSPPTDSEDEDDSHLICKTEDDDHDDADSDENDGDAQVNNEKKKVHKR